MIEVTVSGDDEAQSKYANTSRNKRVRINGEGTVYEFNRTLPSGKTSRAYRASRWIDVGGKRARVTGQGTTTQRAMASLEQAIIRKRVAVGELSTEMLNLTKEEKARTVAQCINDWLSRKRDLSEGSRNGYEAKIRLYLIPYFGDTPVRLLDTESLATFFHDTLPNIRKANGEPYLKSTGQRQVYFILNSVLETALKHRHIVFNPLSAIDAPKRDKKSPREEDDFKRVARWAPMHLMKHIKGDEFEARWMLALMGLRQSEVLGLTDDCIIARRKKSEPGKIKILQQLHHRNSKHGCGKYDHRMRKWPCGKQADRCPESIGVGSFYFVDMTKTPSGVREIPLVEPFYSVVVNHRNRQREFRKSDAFKPLSGDALFSQLLFTTKRGTPRRHQNDRAEWKSLLNRSEVPYNLRLHDARHLAATMLSHLNVAPERIMRIMGWSPQTLYKMLNTYAHNDSSNLKDDMTRYADEIAKRRDDEG